MNLYREASYESILKGEFLREGSQAASLGSGFLLSDCLPFWCLYWMLIYLLVLLEFYHKIPRPMSPHRVATATHTSGN